jgi:hypothetical protein
VRVLRRQRDGRDLRLVADLHDEERQQRGREDAPAGRLLRLVPELVGHQGPGRHRDERHAQDPAHQVRTDGGGEPGADVARDRVVQQRRDQDAEDDRQRLAVFRREHQREQLGLVADLRERDDAGRD